MCLLGNGTGNQQNWFHIFLSLYECNQIFENNYVDAPIVDTRLQPNATHSNLGSHMGDWSLLERVTTSWNPTCLL